MNRTVTLSEQLRAGRLALGLSLRAVARRAGTSVATLSRYENGWTRFETYTLRKLAAALDCDLNIQLTPRSRARTSRTVKTTAVVKQVSRLFWDHPLEAADLRKHERWVLERVLEMGSLEDVRVLRDFMGRRPFLESVAGVVSRLSPRAGSLWRHVLEKEGIPCTKAFYRNTAWHS